MNAQEIQMPAAGKQTGTKTYTRKYSANQSRGKARLSLEAALALVSNALPSLAFAPPLHPPATPICWRLPRVVA